MNVNVSPSSLIGTSVNQSNAPTRVDPPQSIAGTAAAFSEDERGGHGLPVNQNGKAADRDFPEPSTPKLITIQLTSKAVDSLSPEEAQADSYSVIAMMTRIFQERRKVARENRGNELQAQVKTLTGEAEQIRKAGNARFWGNMLSGAAQAIGGALQFGAVGFGAWQAKAAFDNRGPLQAVPLLGKDASKVDFKLHTEALQSNKAALKGFELAIEKTRTWGALGEGFSKGLSGTGSSIHAKKELDAAGEDATKTDLEAANKAHDASYQQASDELHQTQDFMRDLREKLDAMEKSKIETLRSINRNI
ncbi:type III secretion system translocon subunit SctB [Ottowia thiooxydans]|uniref:type III secretion system translocon subunit SctB n=1 Tax=Ottowia thiooxydans TaxID=219182 RepID=UPI00048F69B0|nr:type III secretion system translocon subunit SctB [Ottowia thiooxydans]